MIVVAEKPEDDDKTAEIKEKNPPRTGIMKWIKNHPVKAAAIVAAGAVATHDVYERTYGTGDGSWSKQLYDKLMGGGAAETPKIDSHDAAKILAESVEAAEKKEKFLKLLQEPKESVEAAITNAGEIAADKGNPWFTNVKYPATWVISGVYVLGRLVTQAVQMVTGRESQPPSDVE